MEEEKIRYMVKKTAELLRKDGIPVSKQISRVVINNRAQKRLGACRKTVDLSGRESYTIEISGIALKCGEKEIMEIIIHELLHTCPECLNHGKKWKEYASKVHKMTGYRITSTASYENLGIDVPETSPRTVYRIKCRNCGYIYVRKKICPLVKNPGKYRCGKCGSSLLNAEKSTISCR